MRLLVFSLISSIKAEDNQWNQIERFDGIELAGADGLRLERAGLGAAGQQLQFEGAGEVGDGLGRAARAGSRASAKSPWRLPRLMRMAWAKGMAI